jgi:subtilisin family serine protease
MGCLCSTPIDKNAVRIPTVVRSPTKKKASDDNLPAGVILTGALELRKAGLDGAGVRVAVIDCGIDATHPGFSGRVHKKVWYRYGTPLLEDDHGTHVAGTIHLMAPKAEIYDYRVFGKTGSLPVDEAIAQAIRAATDVNCQVINMSLGAPVSNPAIKSAVQYAYSKGVIMVCAAGNEGDNNPLTNEIRYVKTNVWTADHELCPTARLDRSNSPLIAHACS